MSVPGRILDRLTAGLALLLRAGDVPLPRGLAARVAVRIAGAWKVAPAEVRLAWGRLAGAAAFAEDVPFRVLGSGRDGWRVVVLDPAGADATAVRVRAGVERLVTVAVRRLAPGAAIAPGDLREETRVHWGPPASDATLPGPGWEVARAIAAGEVVAPPAALPPPLVLAGDRVRLEWRRDGAPEALTGIALHAARCGEAVTARLEERPGRLTGIVTGPGVAVLVPAARGAAAGPGRMASRAAIA